MVTELQTLITDNRKLKFVLRKGRVRNH